MSYNQREPSERPDAPPTWLGVIRQTAFVVDDIEAAAAEWLETHGVGPWFLYDVEIEDTDFRGQLVPMRARMGLAQSGSQQIELIEPDPDTPSVYNEFTSRGLRGVHHLCYWTDIERGIAHFRSRGADVVQCGTTAAGNQFVYLSGSGAVPYIELLDPRGTMREFFDTVAQAAEDWNGSTPFR